MSNSDDYRQDLYDTDEMIALFEHYDECIEQCEKGDHQAFEIMDRTDTKAVFQCQFCGTVRVVTADYINKQMR